MVSSSARSDHHPAKPMVAPGHTVGILGGGQLGRLLSLAASRLGLRTHIFCPEADCPAAHVANDQTISAYTDEKALIEFARQVEIVTYEFENVPAETIDILSRAGAHVAPGKKPLAIAQDRLHEKEFVNRIGGKTPLYHAVETVDDLREGLAITGHPAILKTRRFGYDGKGQTRINDASGNLGQTWDAAIAHAWEEIGARPSILEAYVPFTCEISVIAARGWDGQVALYDPPENIHRSGILDHSTVPASVSGDVIESAFALTKTMLADLDYVGVVGVEFFVLDTGELLVNEFAPRVHNSGHWTEAACHTSQFEQHIRAVCGWPLGTTDRHSNAIMQNLIGDDVRAWSDHVSDPHNVLNLYGKGDIREGRKMGHVTTLSPKS